MGAAKPLTPNQVGALTRNDAPRPTLLVPAEPLPISAASLLNALLPSFGNRLSYNACHEKLCYAATENTPT